MQHWLHSHFRFYDFYIHITISAEERFDESPNYFIAFDNLLAHNYNNEWWRQRRCRRRRRRRYQWWWYIPNEINRWSWWFASINTRKWCRRNCISKRLKNYVWILYKCIPNMHHLYKSTSMFHWEKHTYTHTYPFMNWRIWYARHETNKRLEMI